MGPSWLSVVAAIFPLALLFGLLASGRVPGWIAALCAAAASLLAATLGFAMAPVAALSVGLQGALTAVFPILWIVVAALWVHALSVASGQFDVIRSTLASITADRRMQALFIAFAFGAFLEGAAGFGTPVAISAAMLVSLGFPAGKAAVLCLIANSAPVAFAAAGIPVAVAAGVSGFDVMTLGRIIGRQVPFLSLCVPLWLSVVLCGWKRSLEVLPALLVAGILMAGSQFLIANFSGPWTAGILSGIITLAGLWLFLRVWKPATIWDFADGGSGGGANAGTDAAAPAHVKTSASVTLRAWAPYLLMSVMVLLWSLGPLRPLLQRGDLVFTWPGLPGSRYTLALLSTPGTAIFLSGVLSLLLIPPLGFRKVAACFGGTVKSLTATILTVCLILVTAFVMNGSGMSATIGRALSATGALFPLFSPFLGWLGVLLTGSDTSSNALFGSLQRTTAERLGLNPALMVAANASGGVAGKMISPQNIAVATASTRLPGQEGFLFRATVGHSLAMALIIGLITLVQAYLLPGMISHQ
ncbi:MAG: L-lactate permease [Spirochaetia bacterium]|jgi:lactate permease